MNKVELVGRLTKDPEVKLTSNQTQFCNFTVAVDRRFKDSNGQRQADFISCVAWRQTAAFIQKYFRKGSRIGLVGSIQTRNYEDQNGQKRYITEVVVDEAEFVESGNGQGGEQAYHEAPAARPAQSSSFAPPPAGSAASDAPLAPKTQIEPAGDPGFGPGDQVDLPFEI